MTEASVRPVSADERARQAQPDGRVLMRVVDLTQPWGDRIPTWPQFASVEVTDINTHQRHRKSTVLVKTNMHTGTHIDAPFHYAETGKALDQIPLADLVGTGLVIDLRPITRAWSYYSLQDVLDRVPAGEEIREGDVVVFYTGWEQYNWTKPTRDDVMYFDRHPGPQPEVIDYLVDKKIKWVGADLAAIDHSLHTRIRFMRPDLVSEYEQLTGRPIEDTLPERDFEFVHYTTARNNICMLENLGGELAEVASQRVVLGAFPWRWVGGEGCICRVAAFLGVDDVAGASPPGTQPRAADAGTTPARVLLARNGKPGAASLVE